MKLFQFKRFVKRAVPCSPRLYMFKWEYSFLTRNGIFEAIERNDYEKRYSSLTDGLDKESIRTIDRVLERIQIAKRNHGLPIGVYDAKDKEDSRYLIKNLDLEIKIISKDCYAFKQYKLPVPYFMPNVFMSLLGIPEIDTDLGELKGKDIIDAGGFIGDSALVLAPYTERKVYTFEPVQKNFDRLLKTINLNNIQNIVPVKAAVGSQRGELSFQSNGSSSQKMVNSGGGGGSSSRYIGRIRAGASTSRWTH